MEGGKPGGRLVAGKSVNGPMVWGWGRKCEPTNWIERHDKSMGERERWGEMGGERREAGWGR